jgi:hypothetical protein
VLGQDDLVATDILVRGVNLYNKLLTESFVSNVMFRGYGLCGRRPARLVVGKSQARLNLTIGAQ